MGAYGRFPGGKPTCRTRGLPVREARGLPEAFAQCEARGPVGYRVECSLNSLRRRRLLERSFFGWTWASGGFGVAERGGTPASTNGSSRAPGWGLSFGRVRKSSYTVSSGTFWDPINRYWNSGPERGTTPYRWPAAAPGWLPSRYRKRCRNTCGNASVEKGW